MTNPSSAKPEQRLENLLRQFAEYSGNRPAHSFPRTLHDSQAAIQQLIESKIPEKYPDPDEAFIKDKIDYDALCAQRAYNYAIDQFCDNLRRVGLLG